MATVKTVSIKILKACYVDGKVRAIGDVLTVPEHFAREICWMRKAEVVKPEPEKAPDARDAAGGEGDKKKKGGKGE